MSRDLNIAASAPDLNEQWVKKFITVTGLRLQCIELTTGALM
jgi:hypothetical protein